MRKSVVITHANCPDGFGAGYAAWCSLGDSAVYIPWSHGQPAPKLPNGLLNIFIFDFAFSESILEGWIKDGHKVILRDHHVSAERELNHLPYCRFNMDKSGAVLAWEHFFPGEEVPSLLRYVQDYDLWKFELPYSKEINLVIQTTEKDFRKWAELAAELDGPDGEGVAELGKNLINYRDSLVDRAMAANKVQFTYVYKFLVPTVNSSLFQSEIGNLLCKEYPNYPFSAVYYDKNNDEQQWSLRSIGDFDVSEVAKLFGGGGHANASGYTLTLY